MRRVLQLRARIRYTHEAVTGEETTEIIVDDDTSNIRLLRKEGLFDEGAITALDEGEFSGDCGGSILLGCAPEPWYENKGRSDSLRGSGRRICYSK